MLANLVVVMESFIIAVAPIRRFEAMRADVIKDPTASGWFITLGIILITSLIAVLLFMSIVRYIRETRASEGTFHQLCAKSGLSQDEAAILRDISFLAGVKKVDSIFSIGAAFESGSNKLLDEQIKTGLSEVSIRQLRLKLAFLREKLGFYKRFEASNINSRSSDPKTLNTRQIPVNKTIHITRRKDSSKNIEAAVVENDQSGIKVRLANHVAIAFGQQWYGRYYLGQALWEFDTEIISYDGEILVLKHSDNIRYINRRRFLRIPVKEPAGVAAFPFVKGDSGVENNNALITLYPPEFLPATITELGGPGIKMKTKLDVRPGERILVMFKAEINKGEKSNGDAKIIQEVGEIKHRREVDDGYELALELSRVNDREFDELIKLTNAAVMKAASEAHDKEQQQTETGTEKA